VPTMYCVDGVLNFISGILNYTDEGMLPIHNVLVRRKGGSVTCGQSHVYLYLFLYIMLIRIVCSKYITMYCG
jgi:hypothetical protein